MSAMGAHGLGSGPTRRKDGRWQVMVTMPGGKRVYRYAPDEARARKLLDGLREARLLDLDPSRQTVAVYLRSWIVSLRDARRKRVRPRTLDHYTMIVERHIIPALGGLTLEQLTRRRIQAWLDNDDAAPQTVRHHHAVLRRALNRVVGDLIPRNPAVGIELPEPDFAGADPLTVDEARLLITTSADSRFHALWRLAIDTGFREAELLGLARDDVDVDARTVTLRNQLQRRKGQWVRVKPKAARSLDQVSISVPTAEALRQHMLARSAERTPDWTFFGLVFVKANGQPYHARDVLRAFHEACDEAGIRRRRFHDLRASSATLQRTLGVPEDVRMARMGHSTTTMARHYAKARVGIDREAADRLGEALG